MLSSESYERYSAPEIAFVRVGICERDEMLTVNEIELKRNGVDPGTGFDVAAA